MLWCGVVIVVVGGIVTVADAAAAVPVATVLVGDGTEAKEDDLSSVYAEKLENISKIRGTLEQLLADLDKHDEALKSGFSEIQGRIGLFIFFIVMMLE